MTVTVVNVDRRHLAAVRQRVRIGEVATAWKAPLDKVWAFLRTQPGLRADGHNVFVYHHPATRADPMEVDFGVEVTRTFEPIGDVRPAETPVGQAAMFVHAGSYARLHVAHGAIHEWAARHCREFAGTSWEVYGDGSDDPSKLETTIYYLLAR